MNAYYSNLIEGHNTRPKDIERALLGHLDADEGRRNLQLEAASHVRVQAQVDRTAAEGTLAEPGAAEFIQWLHHGFYCDAPTPMLLIRGAGREFLQRLRSGRVQPLEHSPPKALPRYPASPA